MQYLKKEDVIDKINTLRKKDIKNFQTNYFINELDEEIQCFKNNNAIIFLQPDRDIYRLYFAFIEMSDFEELLKKLPLDIKISLEILTKKEIDNYLSECIKKYLHFDTMFERYRCKCEKLRIFQKIEVNQILYAEKKDLAEVNKLLEETFNYYSSHLPSLKELKKLIDNKMVIIEKDKNKISSVVVYKTVGENINFDQLVNLNNEPLKMMHVLDSFYSKIKFKEYNEVFLWIDTIYNKNVIKLHKLYGYKSDLLKDYYFINSALKNTKK